jgi:hypothetical protein
MKKLRIGFIGNFMPAYSTENDRKWSFEKLGHEVMPFQENLTTKQDLLNAMPELDMLVYSHTHDPSYVIEGLIEVFKEYKEAGIPTVSVHLDRWAWLDRVKDVGTEATWFTEYIFMADASPEAVELYDKFNLNWFYLRPGVIERDCYIAEPDPVQFPHEIVFTGSKGYHPEYPQRPALVEWLKETYGDRFGHYGNDGIRVVRGHDLNVLYASAKVVIGDSCFGGRPNYVSDRYFEVRGRGGVLLHPEVDGVDGTAVTHYEPDDFDSLKKEIDSLIKKNKHRESLRIVGQTWVKENETYTNRAQEMLDIIFSEEDDDAE